MKKFLFSLALPLFFLGNTFVSAEALPEKTPDLPESPQIVSYSAPLQVFVRENCAHCQAEKKFLAEHAQELEEKNIKIELIDINENFKEFQEFSDKYEIFGTPITLAGDRIFQGYDNDETGNKIIQAYEHSQNQFTIAQAISNDDAEIFLAESAPVCVDDSNTCSVAPKTITVPFLGETQITGASTQTKYISSFLLGLFDGFNPCAMWVLTVFLIALMQVGDKLKMVFVAGTFILAEAIMYGFILIVWWKFFNILSIEYESIVNIAVGVISLGAGLFFLYEGFFSNGTCNVTNLNQQRSISQKISNIAHSPVTWISFFGILALAFSVNLIEFACSAGYPQIFAKILMPSFAGDIVNQAGIVLTYLGAYILDDLIIFGIAIYSIEKIGITHKFSRAFNIVGGLLMLALGLLMVFAPTLLKGLMG